MCIAGVTFLPVLAFTGETGRLLQPLALTKTLVIGAALIVMLTLAPALRTLLLRGRVVGEFDHPLTRALVRAYRPIVHFALAHPVPTLATAGLALISCLPIAARLGSEFLPRVDEGDLLFMPATLPGIGAEDAQRQLRLQNQIIGDFGEVASVFGKVGRADTATDPAPWSMAETTIRLRPRSEWPKIHRERWYSSWANDTLRRELSLLWPEEEARTTHELTQRLDSATRLPGWASAWTTPARARLDMLATGVRTPVGLRVVAADSVRLEELGAELKPLVERVGISNPRLRAEQTPVGLPSSSRTAASKSSGLASGVDSGGERVPFGPRGASERSAAVATDAAPPCRHPHGLGTACAARRQEGPPDVARWCARTSHSRLRTSTEDIRSISAAFPRAEVWRAPWQCQVPRAADWSGGRGGEASRAVLCEVEKVSAES
ncbi:MAG: efflux RND transporter permease subunit [Deltaproteobacteria bacterium]